MKRMPGNESGREEKDFSPAEMLEKRITSSLRDVGLQEAPPTIVTSETEGHKYMPQANCKALCLLPESLATYYLCLLLRVFATPSTASATQTAFSSDICRQRRRQATLISRTTGLKDVRSTLGMCLAHDTVYGNASQSGVCGIVCLSGVRDS